MLPHCKVASVRGASNRVMQLARENHPLGSAPLSVSNIARIAAASMVIINHDRMKAELLHYFCSAHWGFQVVAFECTAIEGIAAITRTRPDLVLLSLPLRGLSSPEIIREIGRTSPGSKLIIQINQSDECLLHSIRSAAYHGLLFDPEESPTSLGQAIERARLGLRTISPRIAQGQLSLRTDPVAFPKLLSPREQQVLGCIACSMSDGEIGRYLKLSADTAHSHRKKIMKKLGINSTPKLIRYCIDKGFDSTTPPRAGPSPT